MKKLGLIFTLFYWIQIAQAQMLMTPMDDYPRISSFEELQYPFETKKVQLSNDITVAYADEGKGSETIIFIHGLGSYLPAWKKNVEVLRQYYRCIAIDLPGYGKSSKGDYDGSMEFFSDVVIQFADKLGLKQIVLAGHSMGGQISIVTALRYPQRVKALILAAPAGFETFNEGQKQWFREVVTARSTALTPAQTVQSNFGFNFYKFPKDADFMIRDRLAMRFASDFDGYCYIIPKSVQGMVNQPVFDLLDKLTQPTLIVFGESDNLIPNRFLNPGRTRDVALAGYSKIPKATLVMVPKCGHFVQWEGADTFNSAVKKFIDSGFVTEKK
ncbi:MAG: alpha/beta fold hydrolase [Thermaurantimonas sp.]|uniref:alpha/beta fold hydrolase n=1 Tax=Thermaurantimonas sp. TaxID=2681568 RepID=UPI003919D982